MWSELRAFFREPGPERPLGPSRVDRWLVLALVPIVVAEGAVREGLTMRALHITVGVATVCAIWFRRTQPLVAVATAFGLGTIVTLAEIALRLPQTSLASCMCALLLPYSLLRWGSGREIAGGLAFISVAYLTSALSGEMHDTTELVGAAVVLLFPAALGASIRFRAQAHGRDIEHAKLLERTELARDLHDTVAHHVAAIAIQAQGGRAVIAVRPEAAARALEAIEKEASRTLSELRSMVGALRDDRRSASLEPQPGVADIARLAGSLGERMGDAAKTPIIEVDLDDGLVDRLRPAVQSALYRIAQESLTNVVRHARGATCVHIRVRASTTATDARPAVRLTVDDDGAPQSQSARSSSGMGLVGMAERAALLGGTLEAGPRSDGGGGGWTVDVVLPEDATQTLID